MNSQNSLGQPALKEYSVLLGEMWEKNISLSIYDSNGLVCATWQNIFGDSSFSCSLFNSKIRNMIKMMGFNYSDYSIHWKDENGEKLKIVEHGDLIPATLDHAYMKWSQKNDDIVLIVTVKK